jgi:hypothetical protein
MMLCTGLPTFRRNQQAPPSVTKWLTAYLFMVLGDGTLENSVFYVCGRPVGLDFIRPFTELSPNSERRRCFRMAGRPAENNKYDHQLTVM